MATLILKSKQNNDVELQELTFVKGHLLLKRTNRRFRFKASEKNSSRSTQ